MTLALAPGARLGPYLLKGLLGSGGQAEVWEALLEGPGGFQKPVALKLLRPGMDADPQLRAALLREARLGARLQHPNLVGTLLLSQLGDRLGIALELVRGCTGSEILQRLGGPFPPRALLDVALQLARVLHYIHTFRVEGRPAGLVHRDVKPANLLFDTQGALKLADLGISLPLGEEGGVAGTPGYLAPEQAEGFAEPRSDLFAVGATLYALVAGQSPFGRGLRAIAEAGRVESHLRRPEFLTPLEAALPGLGAVVHDCLRLRPEDRLPSAEALHQRLVALQSSARHGPSLGALLGGPTQGLLPPDLAEESGGNTFLEASASTLLGIAGNLRPARDSFVGRQEELEALAELLDRDRWVVLLGPGGLGKTRLALEFARQVDPGHPGGAWAFDLTEARSAAEVCSAVASGLQVPLHGADPGGQLGHALAARGRCLVVLDNLEQCLQALPDTLGRWFALAPEARFLGTSRVRPALAGESLVALGELGEADAARLFEQRAPRPLTEEERALVPGMCAALDRMPLALELAAARLRLLPLQEISARLSLRLLGGGGPDRHQRHRSIQASLAWSWELLTGPAREALLQLSVFEGGFDWQAAEAVLELGPDAPWALDLLQELVDASLIRADRSTGRFSTWVVVREFARERLPGAARSAVEARHGRHYGQLDPQAPGLWRELDNLVAACRAAVARQDHEAAVRTLELAAETMAVRGPFEACVTLATEVRRAEPPPPWGARCRAVLGAALLRVSRPTEAREELAAALAWAEALPDRAAAALPPGFEGQLHARLAQACEALRLDPEAADHLHRALDWFRRAAQPAGEGEALSQLGNRARWKGRVEEAGSLYAAALERVREGAHPRSELTVMGNLATHHLEQGRMEEAESRYRAALALAREHGHRRAESQLLGLLGNLHAAQGRGEEAHAHYEAALRLSRDIGDRDHTGIVLGNLGALEMERGRLGEALAHHQAALAVARELQNRRQEAILLGNLGILHQDQGRIEEARAHYQASLDLHRELENPRSLGIVLGSLGTMLLQLGRIEEARDRLEEALAIHRKVGNRKDEGVVLCSLALLSEAQGREADAETFFQGALDASREVGDRSAEGMVLGHLGDSRRRQGRREEARLLLERGLALAEEVGSLAHQGLVLGYLGEVEADLGERDAARGTFLRGEALLRGASDAHALAHLLAARARAEAAAGDLRVARLLLQEARALAAPLGLADAAPLARTLARTAEVVGEAEA